MKNYIKNISNIKIKVMKDTVETWFWNKGLPVIFKGIEWTLGLTLVYAFYLLIANAIIEGLG